MSRTGAALKTVEPADDVDVLEPPTRTVRLRGREVEIRPMTVGLVPKVTRTLRDVRFGALDSGGIMQLVADHGEAVLEASAYATGIELEEVKALQLPEFVELFAAVLEVNAAFFSQAVARMLATVAQLNGGDGPTSSTSSSPPVTDSPT